MTDYHPEVNLIGLSNRHNLLYPESADGRFIEQPGNAVGGTLSDAKQVNDAFMAVSDNVLAWEDGVFDLNIRRVFSPAPELYLIDDEVRLVDGMPMSFLVNTPLKARIDSCRGVFHGFFEKRKGTSS